MDKVTVFLPCRKGSQRVKNKNIRTFSGIDGGLTFIKLTQLLKVSEVDCIILSTNDKEVIAIAESINHSKIIIDNRPNKLASSTTSTDELIDYVPTIVKGDFILWTHVTSPFIDEDIYSKAINTFFNNSKGYDSLMSVTKLQKFLWNENEPINYDRKIEKWPRTQTIKPIYEINSGIFLAQRETYLDRRDRIGIKPYLYQTDEIESFDIDWENDFEIAENLWNKYGSL